MIRRNIILAFLMLFLLVGCNQKHKTTNIDFGTFKNNRYVNTFFELELPIPEGWEVLSENQNRQLMTQSDELLADNENKEFQKNIETSKHLTVILLTASPNKLDDTSNGFNANLILLAENLSNNEQIKTANEYLLFTRRMLDGNPIPKNYPYQSLIKQNIGGKEWVSLRVDFPAQAVEYSQEYYSILKNNYALTVILTYDNEQQKEQLMSCLSSLTFNTK